jgi:hypothetical protein
MIDLRDFVCAVERIVTLHNLNGPGRYARWLRQDDAGSRDLGINPYGCADAANILYTTGRFPDPDARPEWVAALQELQEADSGLFRGSARSVRSIWCSTAGPSSDSGGCAHEMEQSLSPAASTHGSIARKDRIQCGFSLRSSSLPRGTPGARRRRAAGCWRR